MLDDIGYADLNFSKIIEKIIDTLIGHPRFSLIDEDRINLSFMRTDLHHQLGPDLTPALINSFLKS